MKSLLCRFMAVLGMALAAFLLDGSTPALAGPACDGGLVICVATCPARPNLMCEAYQCSGEGASCTFESCGAVDYAVNCSG